MGAGVGCGLGWRVGVGAGGVFPVLLGGGAPAVRGPSVSAQSFCSSSCALFFPFMWLCRQWVDYVSFTVVHSPAVMYVWLNPLISFGATAPSCRHLCFPLRSLSVSPSCLVMCTNGVRTFRPCPSEPSITFALWFRSAGDIHVVAHFVYGGPQSRSLWHP